MIPDELVQDLQVLREQGFEFSLTEENSKIYILFKNYQLPLGKYNIDKTDLLIFTTPHYPNAGFDMFWVDKTLLLNNDGIPKAAEAIERHLDSDWRRFSYHPYNHKPWNPGEDSVISYMSHVQKRLLNGD